MSVEQKSGIRIFANGSQYMDWKQWNCANCHKQATEDHVSAGGAGHVEYSCKIEDAIDAALWSGGEITPELAVRMAYPGPLQYSWPCGEIVRILPQPEFVKQMTPKPTRLAPLWKRLVWTAQAAWSFWISPFDRTDHDCYEGLRSPLLAWQVAWGIWDDAREPVEAPWWEVSR